MKQLGPTDLKRLHREWHRRTGGRVALLLDCVESPFNIGAIVRSAAAFKIDHLYLAGSTLSPAHSKTGKTAMGTERYLTWTVFERGTEAADAARADGFAVVGLELAAGAAPLHELDAGPDVCIAVGHEDRGLSPATLAACDLVGFIPQLGRVGSLNVATATAIAIYEFRRRAWNDAEADSGS
ncbi:MAG: tRNA (guanosine-2-O-)-methyltransferase [Acidimicrobiaceae bacterium]|nr:tRNA (guanosine-2-O-)-methyltransferase [Acidimicrobiaceae bacterium]